MILIVEWSLCKLPPSLYVIIILSTWPNVFSVMHYVQLVGRFVHFGLIRPSRYQTSKVKCHPPANTQIPQSGRYNKFYCPIEVIKLKKCGGLILKWSIITVECAFAFNIIYDTNNSWSTSLWYFRCCHMQCVGAWVAQVNELLTCTWGLLWPKLIIACDCGIQLIANLDCMLIVCGLGCYTM